MKTYFTDLQPRDILAVPEIGLKITVIGVDDISLSLKTKTWSGEVQKRESEQVARDIRLHNYGKRRCLSEQTHVRIEASNGEYEFIRIRDGTQKTLTAHVDRNTYKRGKRDRFRN